MNKAAPAVSLGLPGALQEATDNLALGLYQLLGYCGLGEPQFRGQAPPRAIEVIVGGPDMSNGRGFNHFLYEYGPFGSFLSSLYHLRHFHTLTADETSSLIFSSSG